jgi:arginyl-tRNA synthetase
MMAYETLLEAARSTIDAALVGMPRVAYAVEPARPGFGDASSNAAFLMAGSMKMRPSEVAARIAERCRPGGLVAKVEAHPSGYLNVQADWDVLSGRIMESCMSEGYGGGFEQRSSVVEHTSVNPNKALHIGHVRNVIIGDTISRILRKAGDRVTVLNYIDDSGLQVADVVLGFTQMGYDTEPPPGKKFDAYCGDVVYVGVTERAGENPSLKERSREILAEIERGGTESAKMAAEVTRRVLANQLETCWSLGVKYDMLNYESQIVRSGLWETTFGKLKEMGIATLAQEGENVGCWVIHDKVIVRSNGTATYMAKDIPYAAWKMGLVDDPFTYVEYGPQPGGNMLYESVLEGGRHMKLETADRVITVIDSRQADLQKIISGIMERFGGGEYTHLGYEAVTLSAATAGTLGVKTDTGSQMSGRRGIYVGADHMYAKLRDRAAEETAKRNPDMSEGVVDSIARAVAVGAIRYEMIRQDLGRAITFDMERSTRLEGDTAPYLQYSHARARRILERAATRPDYTGDMSVLSQNKERVMLRLLGMYNIVVGDAYRNLAPKVVARYCHDLAVAFNTFYESYKVIGAGELENPRLCLTGAFCKVISDALGVLGIPAPERM